MEMAGFSISLFKLDEELKALIDTPAETPFFKQLWTGGARMNVSFATDFLKEISKMMNTNRDLGLTMKKGFL